MFAIQNNGKIRNDREETALGTCFCLPTQYLLKVEKNINKDDVINIQEATTPIARSSNK